MPTPPLTREKCREVVEAFVQAQKDGYKPGGSPSARQVASDRLGISRNTFDGRMIRAKTHYNITPDNLDGDEEPAPVKPDFPNLPDDDLPAEEIIEIMKRRFAKRKERAQAEKWCEVKVPIDGPFAVVYWGDPHLDSNGCDIEAVHNHAELCAKTEGVYAVNIGDTVDNWPQSGRLVKLYAQSDQSESTAWKLAKWFLKDSGINWIVWLLGNHDLWNQGSFILREMNGARVPMFDWGAQFKLLSGGYEWKVWASHDFPGHSQWNTLHGAGKAAKIQEKADLYICGHKHNWALHQEESGSRDFTYWLARARGYKYLDDHSRKLGHFPQERGASIVAVHDTNNGNISCFSDIEEGLDFLKFKRSR